MLRGHPELLDVFVAQAPEFRRLTNPLMRRTFARMATVAQAADVAHMPVQSLLDALNGALGFPIDAEVHPMDQTPSSGGAGAPTAETPPDWLGGAPVVAEVDARDMQRQGQDPFFVLMDTARGVALGEVMQLRNTFAPVPLFGVLSTKGFEHYAQRLADDDWLISFYRSRPASAEADADDTHPHGAVRPTATADADATAAGTDVDALFAADGPPQESAVAAVVTITVDDLTPPVPMQKVLEGLATVSPGQLLLVHHLRMPPHLTAKLDEQGHRYRIWDLGPDRKEILIEKAPA